MKSCNFWDDNYFHILFNESSISYECQLVEERHQQVVPTNFQDASSTIVELLIDPSFYFYMKDPYAYGYTSLDPHDHHGHVTPNTQWFMELQFHHCVFDWSI